MGKTSNIVRICNRGHDQYGYSGIEIDHDSSDNTLTILLLKDADGKFCCRVVHRTLKTEIEYTGGDDDELALSYNVNNNNIHTIANDMSSLMRDGKKFREIMKIVEGGLSRTYKV